MNEETIKNEEIQRISKEGKRIYEEKKADYESLSNGKFVAIDIDTEKTYIGDTTAEALNDARQENPGKIFYVVKVGFDVVATMANLLRVK